MQIHKKAPPSPREEIIPGDILVATLAFVGLDQGTKWLAVNIWQIAPFKLLPYIQLIYSENTGIAFGIPLPFTIITVGSLLLLSALFLWIPHYVSLRHWKGRLAIALLLGGAIGNIIDRLWHGYVIDFIRIGWWPTFNLADAFLTISIFLIVIFYDTIKRTTKTSTKITRG